MKKMFVLALSTVAMSSYLGIISRADMDLEADAAVSGMAVALNNYKAGTASPQKALARSVKAASRGEFQIDLVNGQSATERLIQEVAERQEPVVDEGAYEDVAIAQSPSTVIIRSGAGEETEAVGRMKNKAAARILSAVSTQEGDWLKIRSGNVEGYVPSAYLSVGDSALAKEAATTYGVVTDTKTLRLRENPDQDAKTLTLLSQGERYEIVGQQGDFLKVQVDDDLVGYAVKDFIKTDVVYDTAISTQEEALLETQRQRRKMEAQTAMAKLDALVEGTAAESLEETGMTWEALLETEEGVLRVEPKPEGSARSTITIVENSEPAGQRIPLRSVKGKEEGGIPEAILTGDGSPVQEEKLVAAPPQGGSIMQAPPRTDSTLMAAAPAPGGISTAAPVLGAKEKNSETSPSSLVVEETTASKNIELVLGTSTVAASGREVRVAPKTEGAKETLTISAISPETAATAARIEGTLISATSTAVAVTSQTEETKETLLVASSSPGTTVAPRTEGTRESQTISAISPETTTVAPRTEGTRETQTISAISPETTTIPASTSLLETTLAPETEAPSTQVPSTEASSTAVFPESKTDTPVENPETTGTAATSAAITEETSQGASVQPRPTEEKHTVVPDPNAATAQATVSPRTEAPETVERTQEVTEKTVDVAPAASSKAEAAVEAQNESPRPLVESAPEASIDSAYEENGNNALQTALQDTTRETKMVDENVVKAKGATKQTETAAQAPTTQPQTTRRENVSRAAKVSQTTENPGPGATKAQTTAAPTTQALKSASRSAIAAYARQFEGNPYKWGGVSLTEGADCSGFTMQVYKHFGINIGRNSGEQATRGREIPISSVQPGDLVFYANKSGGINHVAMYLGNGQLIHASNAKTGIIITNMNYRTPCKAVTFLR